MPPWSVPSVDFGQYGVTVEELPPSPPCAVGWRQHWRERPADRL